MWKNTALQTAKNVAKGKKAIGGLAAGMIKGGANLVKKSAKVTGTKFNKIAKVGKAAKKAGSKLTEKLGGFMTKIGEILSTVLKKFKIDAPTDKIDDLVSSLTKTFTTKIDDMGAKAAKGFSDAIPVIGQAIWVADMVVTGTNAWGDAENILGIIEEATTGEKIIATLIALINEGIPVIGGKERNRMELIERMRKVMADKYGIHTDEELNKAFDEMDTSFLSLFVPQTKEQKNE
jgi:hypothetical protein